MHWVKPHSQKKFKMSKVYAGCSEGIHREFKEGKVNLGSKTSSKRSTNLLGSMVGSTCFLESSKLFLDDILLGNSITGTHNCNL